MLADVRLNRQIDDPWLNPIAEARGLGQSIVVASRVPFLLASRSTSSKLVDQFVLASPIIVLDGFRDSLSKLGMTDR